MGLQERQQLQVNRCSRYTLFTETIPYDRQLVIVLSTLLIRCLASLLKIEIIRLPVCYFIHNSEKAQPCIG